MVKNNPYKRQKLASGQLHRTQEISLFPPTRYEESKATLKNFPSSIVNGITVEGGLYSLTFKSINCATYVEQNEIMKGVLRVNELDLPKISNVNLQEMKESLKNDIESDVGSNKNNKGSQDSMTTDSLINDLQDTLENGKGLGEFDKKLKNSFKKEISVCGKDYQVVSNVKIPNLKIDSFEDVNEPDLSAYEKIPAKSEVSLEEHPKVEEVEQQPKVEEEVAKVEEQASVEASVEAAVEAAVVENKVEEAPSTIVTTETEEEQTILL